MEDSITARDFFGFDGDDSGDISPWKGNSKGKARAVVISILMGIIFGGLFFVMRDSELVQNLTPSFIGVLVAGICFGIITNSEREKKVEDFL